MDAALRRRYGVKNALPSVSTGQGNTSHYPGTRTPGSLCIIA